MSTSAEKRKALRRAISYPAFVDLGQGAPMSECTLCDASQDGAQLLVAEPDKLPDQFVLALSADGAARRKCKVVWRTGNQIGVEFLRDPKKVFRKRSLMHHFLPGTAEQAEAAEGVDPFDIDSLSQR